MSDFLKRTFVFIAVLLISCVCVFAGTCYPGCKNGFDTVHTATDEKTGYCADCGGFDYRLNDIRMGEKRLYRTDLEQAAAEMGWAFFLKGNKVQYDSQGLNEKGSVLNKYFGGWTKLSYDAGPEDATKHNTVYSVCTDYAVKIYKQILGFNINGYSLNGVTDSLWVFSEVPQDSTVFRWWSDSYSPSSGYAGYGSKEYSPLQKQLLEKGFTAGRYDQGPAAPEKKTLDPENKIFSLYNIKYDKSLTTQSAREFCLDYEKNLRPGDVFTTSGHTLVYIGGPEGIVLDSHGSKYNGRDNKGEGPKYILPGTDVSYKWGAEFYENQGTHRYVTTMPRLMAPDGENIIAGPHRNSYLIADTVNGKKGPLQYVLLHRPINLFMVSNPDAPEDITKDVFNTFYRMPEYTDYMVDGKGSYLLMPPEVKLDNFTLTPSAKAHVACPGLTVDKFVDATPYGTAFENDTLTYTVRLINYSNTESEYSRKAWYNRYKKAVLGDPNYAGETYTVTVKEAIPEGTTLVQGNNIQTVTLKPGQSYDATFTVKVNAPVNLKEIVSPAGEVVPQKEYGGAFITPQITNKIAKSGAQNLSAQAVETIKNANAKTISSLEALNAFYTKNLKVGLELPSVQGLVSSLFERKEVVAEHGYSRAALRNRYDMSQSAYLFFPKDNSYLVEGYWGGRMFTNEYRNLKRIYEPRMDYLKPGDILFYVDFENENSDKDAGAITKWDAYVLTDEFFDLNSDWEVDDFVEDVYFGIEGHSQNKRVRYGDGYGKAVHISSYAKAEDEDRMLFYNTPEAISDKYLGYTNKSDNCNFPAGPIWECFNRDLFFVIRPVNYGSHAEHHFENGICKECGLMQDRAEVTGLSLTAKSGTVVYNVGAAKTVSVFARVSNYSSVTKKVSVTLPATKWTAQAKADKSVPAKSDVWVELKAKVTGSVQKGESIVFSNVSAVCDGNTSSYGGTVTLNIVSNRSLSNADALGMLSSVSYQPENSMKRAYDAVGLKQVFTDYETAMLNVGLKSTTISSLMDSVAAVKKDPDSKYAKYLSSLVVKDYQATKGEKLPEIKPMDLKAGDCFYLMGNVNDSSKSCYCGAVVRGEDVVFCGGIAKYNGELIATKSKIMSLEEFSDLIADLQDNLGNAKKTNLTKILFATLIRPSQAYENINNGKSAF